MYLLAQLEDGEGDRDDEREERQLERVPGLQSKDSQGEGHQGNDLQQDEHQDGDDDLLQLGLAWLDSWSPGLISGEVDVDVKFFVIEAAGRYGDLGSGDGELESDIVTLEVFLDNIEEVATGRAAGDFVSVVVVARYFDGFGYLEDIYN